MTPLRVHVRMKAEGWRNSKGRDCRECREYRECRECRECRKNSTSTQYSFAPFHALLCALCVIAPAFDPSEGHAARAERSSASTRFQSTRTMSLIISASCQRSESSRPCAVAPAYQLQIAIRGRLNRQAAICGFPSPCDLRPSICFQCPRTDDTLTSRFKPKQDISSHAP